MRRPGLLCLRLDPNKQPIKTIASNPGHACGVAFAPDRAEAVMRRLFMEDMWSGWGIRTLSANNPAYNPFSYQRGSVWPHDNGIIALGFKRYGFDEAVNRVAWDICEAASYFQDTVSGALRGASAAPRHVPDRVPRGQHPAGVGRRNDLSPNQGHLGPSRRCAVRWLRLSHVALLASRTCSWKG